MWEISQVVCMVLLAGLAAVDLWYKKIPVSILALAGISASGYQIFLGKEDIWLIAGGIGIGMVFLLISRVTEEEMGYGDSLAILIMGIYLGMWGLLEALAGAFLLLAAASVICLAVKRMSGKCRLPFYPFLAIGYLLSVL